MGNESSSNIYNQSNSSLKPPTNESASSYDDDRDEIDTISVVSTMDTASIFSESTNIINGVINEHISQRLVGIATTFWLINIEQMSMEDKLEIGCSIFFGMISANSKIKKIMHANLSKHNQIEIQSVKFLDMISWLLRNLSTDSIDLFVLLQKLGKMHCKMGIQINQFDVMIKSLHSTMVHYFPKSYNIQIQYAMEQIIRLSAQIMTEKHFKRIKRKNKLKLFRGINTPFLQSLEACLSCDIGSEYFYRYLINNYSEELVIYLKLIQKFKDAELSEKYNIGIELMTTCIIPTSSNAINISYETRNCLLNNFTQLKQKQSISEDYFEDVEMEMRRLIVKNYWKRFVHSIADLHNSVHYEK